MSKLAKKYSDRNALNADLADTYKKFQPAVERAGQYRKTAVSGVPGVFRLEETPESRRLAIEVMKTALRHPMPDANNPANEGLIKQWNDGSLSKASINVSSNFTPYDLFAPSLHLVPWLTPLRESLNRRQRPYPGPTFHWKVITPATFTRGGLPASPWLNEGQRAPLQTISANDANATYVSLGIDSSVTYEAESSSDGFEDAVALGHLFALENLMVKEEDALMGGDATLLLGRSNTPTGTSGTDMYVAVVGLTYEGYRNFTQMGGIDAGLTQTLSITTPDSKVMSVNAGSARPSAISAHLAFANAVSVVPKNGEVAWVWYIGSTNTTSALYIAAVTTVPGLAANAFSAVPSTGQTLDDLADTDFSVNNGSQGGGTNQVKGFDGFITQTINNAILDPANAYYRNMSVTLSSASNNKLTSNGTGGIEEIDAMLTSLWENFKVTVDEIWVNAQELKNITAGVLSNASGPLLRFDKDASGDKYDLTASGTISFYFNPYIPGGRKILIMVHPTLPPGTMVAYGKSLPPYFKSNSTPNVAEVITRRDYYAKEWAATTREYEFGVYSEETLAVYAPFALAVISGIGDGINIPS